MKRDKRPPPPKLEAGSDVILRRMVEKGMPLTKALYLQLICMGDEGRKREVE